MSWQAPNTVVSRPKEVTVLIAKYMDIERRKVIGFEPLSLGRNRVNLTRSNLSIAMKCVKVIEKKFSNSIIE